MNIHYFLSRIRTRVRNHVKSLIEALGPQMVSAQTLPDEDFLALFELETVSTLLEQGDISAAKGALLNHLGCRTHPGWPECPKVITDLNLETNHLSQKELIVLADAILDNRIFHNESNPSIATGGLIDWQVNPASDPAWLRRLHRHQWWSVLGLAYAYSHDERYATAFVRQMVDWVKGNPPLSRKNEGDSAWRLMEVGLRLRVSWIPSFALFFESPIFTDDAKLVMLRAIYDHARFLRHFKTNRNHLLRESNGLASAAIYFPEFKEARTWQQIALTRLDEELVEQVNQDGSHIEVSSGYQWLVVDEFEQTYELLQANDLSLPRENLAVWLEKMYQVLAYIVRPDGTFPEINDGFLHWPYTRLASAGELFRRDDFAYLGTAGKQGTPPGETSVAVNDAGLYVMRSNWVRDAHYLLFDAGPYGGPHGHEDKLSIEVFAHGQPFIVDSGSYTYDDNDPLRLYFVGTQGHNTVLVDGESQIRRWQEENLRPKRAIGNYAKWISRPDFDYVVASYDDGYSTFQLRKPKDAVVTAGVNHTRQILFVKPDYWLIVDEIQAATAHSYQLLFHAHPDLVVDIGPDKQAILNAGPNKASLYLCPLDPSTIQIKTLTGGAGAIQSWCSVGFHRKKPSTVVVYEQENQPSTLLATLLYPCAAGETADNVRLKAVEVEGGNGRAFEVISDRGQDFLMLSPDDSLKQFAAYRSSGSIAGVRLDNQGNVISQFEA